MYVSAEVHGGLTTRGGNTEMPTCGNGNCGDADVVDRSSSSFRDGSSVSRYGIVSAQGVGGVGSAIRALHEDQANLPVLARFALHGLVAQLRSIEGEIKKIEAEILKWHRTNETSRRLATIPGIGPITASAIAPEFWLRGVRSPRALRTSCLS